MYGKPHMGSKFQGSPETGKTTVHRVWGKFCTSHCIPGRSKVILQVKQWNEKGLIWCDVMMWLRRYVRLNSILMWYILVDLNYFETIVQIRSNDLPRRAHEYRQRHHLLWNMFPSFSRLNTSSQTEPLTRLAPRKVSKVPDLSGVCCSSDDVASPRKTPRQGKHWLI